jgi:Putative transposase
MSRPALPQVSGSGSTRVAGRARGRAIAGAVLPRRILAAGQNRPNKAAIYDILFKASAEKPLNHNPHVHMIVPGGGISRDGARWVACRPDFLRAPPWAPGGISPPHLSKRRSSSRYKSRMRRAIALASSSPVMQQSFLRRPATARNPGRLSPLLGHYGGPRECRRDKH